MAATRVPVMSFSKPRTEVRKPSLRAQPDPTYDTMRTKRAKPSQPDAAVPAR